MPTGWVDPVYQDKSYSMCTYIYIYDILLYNIYIYYTRQGHLWWWQDRKTAQPIEYICNIWESKCFKGRGPQTFKKMAWGTHGTNVLRKFFCNYSHIWESKCFKGRGPQTFKKMAWGTHGTNSFENFFL